MREQSPAFRRRRTENFIEKAIEKFHPFRGFSAIMGEATITASHVTVSSFHVSLVFDIPLSFVPSREAARLLFVLACHLSFALVSAPIFCSNSLSSQDGSTWLNRGSLE